MTQPDPEAPTGEKPSLLPKRAPVPDEQLWSWVDRDAPELAAHLASHPEDRTRVDELRRAIRAVAGPERDDRLPDRIGPYPIKGRLGSGGMGVVFEAVQVRTNRRVAVKVIRGAWLDDEKTRRLFFREAEVLGRLQHTGIAAIHDAGETKEGSPYFVMELIDGDTLDDWAKGRKLDDKLSVAIQIARAVDHAHEKGVIHRDLKPSNVIVTEDGEAKVLDFGLARIVDPGANASLTAAMSGKMIGTVRYMSPEQARGLASGVTPASDVYSMGVLLYELCTGNLPHDFEGADLFECARRVAEDKIKPASRWVKGLSPDLDSVIQRALAKDPAARYSSAAELAEDLERVRAGQPVEARTEALDLGEVLGRFGLEIGSALGKAGTEIGNAAGDIFRTKQSVELREGAVQAATKLKDASLRATTQVKAKAAELKSFVGSGASSKAAGDRHADSTGDGESPGPTTIRIDLNPVLDIAGSVATGMAAVLRAVFRLLRAVGRRLLSFVGTWSRRLTIITIVVFVIALVEYDGNVIALFDQIGAGVNRLVNS